MTDPRDEPLRLLRAGDLPEHDDRAWLVDHIWGHSAVGIVGGPPKQGKTWFSLDIAVSVASGTDCLGEFAVPAPGPVLTFFAEESLAAIRDRLTKICAARGLDLESLDIKFLDTPHLRLDQARDLRRLRKIVSSLRPKLIIMDPLVRLHRLSESDTLGMSHLLGDLRGLQREFDTAILLVHHSRKATKKGAIGGQELRGTGDLHAWVDSAVYLDNESPPSIEVEHRAAPPLCGRRLKLCVDGDAAWLEAPESAAGALPSGDLAETVFASVKEGLTNRDEIAKRVGRRKSEVVRTLGELVAEGRLVREGRIHMIPVEAATE